MIGTSKTYYKTLYFRVPFILASYEYIVGYEKSSDEFDIGHCQVKVKVTA